MAINTFCKTLWSMAPPQAVSQQCHPLQYDWDLQPGATKKRSVVVTSIQETSKQMQVATLMFTDVHSAGKCELAQL